MGNMKETHNVFLRFFFQKHFLCFHGKNPLESQNVSLNGFFWGKHHPAPAVKNGGQPRIWNITLRQAFIEEVTKGVVIHSNNKGFGSSIEATGRLKAMFDKMIFHVSNILGGDDKVMEFREKRWRNSGGRDRRCQHILLMKMVKIKTYREGVGGVHSGDKGVIQLLNSDSSLLHLRMWKSFIKCPERGRVLNLRSQMSQGGILDDTFKGVATMILLREEPTLQLVMTFISRQSWLWPAASGDNCESCKEQTKSSRWLAVGEGGKEWEEILEVQSGTAVTREGIEKWRRRGAWSDQRVWPRTSKTALFQKKIGKVDKNQWQNIS